MAELVKAKYSLNCKADENKRNDQPETINKLIYANVTF